MKALPAVVKVKGEAVSINGLANVPMSPVPLMISVLALIKVPGCWVKVPPLVRVSVPPKGVATLNVPLSVILPVETRVTVGLLQQMLVEIKKLPLAVRLPAEESNNVPPSKALRLRFPAALPIVKAALAVVLMSMVPPTAL